MVVMRTRFKRHWPAIFCWEHTHFHVVFIDGIFEPDLEQGAHFIEVEELDADDAEAVQTQIRRRILRAFVRRGLLEKADRQEMEQWDHGGGFSLDASVRIAAHDRRGLERHRHRYYGVLAPNSPLRPAVTALAPQPVAAEPDLVAARRGAAGPTVAARAKPASFRLSPCRDNCLKHLPTGQFLFHRRLPVVRRGSDRILTALWSWGILWRRRLDFLSVKTGSRKAVGMPGAGEPGGVGGLNEGILVNDIRLYSLFNGKIYANSVYFGLWTLFLLNSPHSNATDNAT
ncbi:hypothetical protein D5085_17420 [Ectothiorhodospiraceae bacterium BW-2]|nr:hypothetical protein D5085_17420 [Ectothiorhodospiraceae bacterium BW-2]